MELYKLNSNKLISIKEYNTYKSLFSSPDLEARKLGLALFIESEFYKCHKFSSIYSYFNYSLMDFIQILNNHPNILDWFYILTLVLHFGSSNSNERQYRRKLIIRSKIKTKGLIIDSLIYNKKFIKIKIKQYEQFRNIKENCNCSIGAK